MPTITFITHDGNEHKVESGESSSVMSAALDNLVPGIDGDCGGECSCATCHVYIETNWQDKVGSPSENENAMLDLNPERQENSRLCCQIKVSDDIDGLVVRVPEFQF